ncbi:unnamed protein product [Phytophthora lilii]|uniref:Unnamed protein product n=1 Tax=Phytophthora lilii TaxID=2077276 RepID=A0A9W6U853_9STRA|nr:unnamed protein product [Phytophthora lilii]
MSMLRASWAYRGLHYRLERISPAEFIGNQFMCPLPTVLLQSNLTCICGNGYTVNTTKLSTLGIVSASDAAGQEVPANEAVDLCVHCPEGFYSNATSDQICRQCPAGSSPSEKSDHCELCLPGTYANESGLLSCIPCSPGTFASGAGATSCNLCHPGAFSADQGSTKCTECPVGTFSASMSSSVCSQCPPGSYTNAEGETECLLCPVGMYQDSNGSASCKTCPPGFIAPQPGHVKCSPCPPGSSYDAVMKTCILCHPGTFSSVAAQIECTKCEEGMAAEGVGHDKCLGVADPGWGYLSPDAVTAVKCNVGSFNNGSWRSCQLCPPGTFAASAGSQTCTECGKGTFASTRGSSQCVNAPPGSFISIEGAVQADLCPPNHVAALDGLVECTPCQPPSFSFLPGGIECSFTKPGEVREHIQWPRLRLELTGVDQVALSDAKDDDVSPIDVVIKLWADTLTSYTTSNRRLHTLQVSRPMMSSSSVHVIVAVETIMPMVTNNAADNGVASEVENAVHHAVETAESALGELLDELVGSSTGGASDAKIETQQLTDVVVSRSFRDAFVRQLNRANVLDGTLSFEMLTLSVVDPPFVSTRAVPCAPGTFFSSTLSSNESACQLCPKGSFSASSGALECKPCPRGTFAAEEGLATCKPCSLGADAAPGASSCTECSWFTYACEGFWANLAVAMGISAALARKFFNTVRRLCVGDNSKREQDESAALMAAVRSHGRTVDGVHYAPMVRLRFAT